MARNMVGGKTSLYQAIIVLDLLDNSIRDENYLFETYDIPVLAAVPDMDSKKSGGYYKDYAAKPNKNVKA